MNTFYPMNEHGDREVRLEFPRFLRPARVVFLVQSQQSTIWYVKGTGKRAETCLESKAQEVVEKHRLDNPPNGMPKAHYVHPHND